MHSLEICRKLLSFTIAYFFAFFKTFEIASDLFLITIPKFGNINYLTLYSKEGRILHHYIKGVSIWSFPGPYFLTFGHNRYGVVVSPNAGKYGPETPNTDTFHAVHFSNFLVYSEVYLEPS